MNSNEKKIRKNCLHGHSFIFHAIQNSSITPGTSSSSTRRIFLRPCVRNPRSQFSCLSQASAFFASPSILAARAKISHTLAFFSSAFSCRGVYAFRARPSKLLSLLACPRGSWRKIKVEPRVCVCGSARRDKRFSHRRLRSQHLTPSRIVTQSRANLTARLHFCKYNGNNNNIITAVRRTSFFPSNARRRALSHNAKKSQVMMKILRGTKNARRVVCLRTAYQIGWKWFLRNAKWWIWYNSRRPVCVFGFRRRASIAHTASHHMRIEQCGGKINAGRKMRSFSLSFAMQSLLGKIKNLITLISERLKLRSNVRNAHLYLSMKNIY